MGKGQFGFEKIARIILVLVVLVILLVIIFLYKDRMYELVTNFKDFITFGR